MVVICIGPVCIPLWGLLPFFVAFAAKCWEWMKQRLGFASGGGATTRSATAVISAGVASAEAAAARLAGEAAASVQPRVVSSIAEWDELRSTATAAGKMLFVDFSAGFCKPCKRVAPVFVGLARRHGERAFFAQVESDSGDSAEALADACGVSCYPTFQVYGGGDASSGAQKLAQFVGAKDDELARFVLANLGHAASK
jgi:thioredoxin 1